MKNTKRIFAVLGVIVLIGMYLITLILALIDNPHTFDLFKISVGLTILIPVLLWIYIAMYRYVKQRRQANQDDPNEK
ncbi:MAG: hypothetical protein HFJ05_05475 [Eubacterium sp.]|nr:hypothetical protein [Eubacterium sp.]